jgi:hypothetical protein
MTDEQPEPPAIRVSDAEREGVAERLRHAAGEGRLTVEELAERIDRAYEARTAGELVELTADLPAAPASAAPATAKRPRRWLLSIMGGGDLRGRWRVGERLTAIAVMGGGAIDLRQAVLESDEVTITAVAVMGGFDIIVPPGADVEVSGFDFMGGRDVKLSGDPPRPGAPRIHVRAFALMGGIDVKEKPATRSSLPPPPPEPPRLP